MSSSEVPGSDPSTELGADLAQAAVDLFSAGSLEDTLSKVVELAVTTVDGCDFAGIFLDVNGKVTTPALSDPVVFDIDSLQHSTGEGPCLDAMSQRSTFYADELGEDPRWPRFGPEATERGMRSLLAVPMFTNGTRGALNLYGHYPRAFGALDRARGLILAALAGLALVAARTHEEEDRRAAHLQDALVTREVIGQAQGILMERERISSDHAFDILRRASQHLNVKLRDVAQRLVDTGEDPVTGATDD